MSKPAKKSMQELAVQFRKNKIEQDKARRLMPMSTDQKNLLIDLGADIETIENFTRGQAYELINIMLPPKSKKPKLV